MLVHLTVHDFVIVDHLELAIEAGMTVMTGETGAGKSILVDALGLALGERASGSVVRAGCKRAEVGAIFDISRQAGVREWLQEQGFDNEEPECILRRSITADGRTRAFIDGGSVPIQTLRELGSLLVDIHGQHAHQSLLKASAQRDIVDAYAGNGAERREIVALYEESKAKKQEISRYAGEAGELDTRLEWLRFQVKELENLQLQPGEWQALDEEHRRLGHGVEIIGICQEILHRVGIDSDNAALSQIDSSLRSLGSLCAYDKRLEEIHALFDTALIHLKEGSESLRQYVNELDVDGERLQWIESRLAAIHDLARKHRVPPEGLETLLDKWRQEIDKIEEGAASLAEHHRQLAALQQHYRTLALRLRKKRIDAGGKLAAEITGNLQRLGMSGQVEISVSSQDEAHPTATGLDEVTFQISVNPGQPLKPLSLVASGGELSRIALAIQVIVSQDTGTPTLIFDEVDAGIGGQVAEIVGQHLRHLGKTRQVLCITHLPQVASQAHHHVKIQKYTDADSTKINLTSLKESARTQEVARMLGGVRITDKTLAHAREMLGDNAKDESMTDSNG
uniref:DNA repair protein RecN n=1 Tax=Candidatus Kentrum sp. MB TaxID=2138164 RepID=A0A451BFF2_9GAMM|nr:MAG: DNA replication and repair protein RecN [Candidatus Kentron sp. MB]VFK34859.1 MAG: DNA replication and repair protein RecN [Candidatus Kentron sp. MB]VFK77008.1 MAG: DNA replication and repair protein RecN [Candidatus Kentron sp. MB]